MSDKPNGSRLKLYITQDVGQPLGIIDRLVTEQISLDISRNTEKVGVTQKGPVAAKQYLPGDREVELSVDFIMDAAQVDTPERLNYITLSNYEETKKVLQWKVKLDNADLISFYSFRAFISHFSTSAPLEEKILCSMTLTPST